MEVVRRQKKLEKYSIYLAVFFALIALKRDWKTLGPKLEGKIHIYCGDMDNYYLNNAVYLVEEFLKSSTNPFYAGEVDYGDRAEHCWNGDHNLPNHLSRLRYNVMRLPKILERIKRPLRPGRTLAVGDISSSEIWTSFCKN